MNNISIVGAWLSTFKIKKEAGYIFRYVQNSIFQRRGQVHFWKIGSACRFISKSWKCRLIVLFYSRLKSSGINLHAFKKLEISNIHSMDTWPFFFHSKNEISISWLLLVFVFFSRFEAHSLTNNTLQSIVDSRLKTFFFLIWQWQPRCSAFANTPTATAPQLGWKSFKSGRYIVIVTLAEFWELYTNHYFFIRSIQFDLIWFGLVWF